MPSDGELTDEEIIQLHVQWSQGEYTWDWETHLAHVAARKMAWWVQRLPQLGPFDAEIIKRELERQGIEAWPELMEVTNVEIE